MMCVSKFMYNDLKYVKMFLCPDLHTIDTLCGYDADTAKRMVFMYKIM